MSKYALTKQLTMVLLIMIGLNGCSASKINQTVLPSLKPTFLTLPDNPTDRDYQHVISICVIERGVLYKDILRNAKTQKKLNRKWWQVWR